MSDYVRFAFDDGTSVVMEVFPGLALGGFPYRADAQAPSADLPSGSASVDAVSRAGDAVEKAGKALSLALRPLVPVLEAIHQTVAGAAQPPDEVAVELGLKLSSDLHLMVVGGNGEASFTVTAKWDLRRA